MSDEKPTITRIFDKLEELSKSLSAVQAAVEGVPGLPGMGAQLIEVKARLLSIEMERAKEKGAARVIAIVGGLVGSGVGAVAMFLLQHFSPVKH